jgi:cytochrome c5
MDATEAQNRWPSRSSGGCRTRGRGRSLSGIGVLAALALAFVGCGQRESAPAGGPPRLTVAAVDSVLAELGGSLTDSLSRQQRWRMISSIGTGLPPKNYQVSDLPQPRAYGAAMLQVYCEQCHWLPSPQMHSAAEWPLLVRRMLLRMHMLQDRMGGPMINSLVGGWMVNIIKKVGIPSPQQVDSIEAYLERNALPVASPGEVGDSPAAQLFAQKCSVCHQTPSPRAHAASEWEGVVARMQSNMARMDVKPLMPEQVQQITKYLQEHGKE